MRRKIILGEFTSFLTISRENLKGFNEGRKKGSDHFVLQKVKKVCLYVSLVLMNGIGKN